MGDHYRPFGGGWGSGGGGGSPFGNKVPYTLHGSETCSPDGSPDQNVCQAGTAAPVPPPGPNVYYSPQSLGAGGCPDVPFPSNSIGSM